MKVILCLFAALGPATLGFAQQKSEAATQDGLAKHAAQALETSIQELNTLRDQIANEKLPLAQELTALEEKLSELRREHDRVTRLIDSGNLELPAIKAEIKVRQDEARGR